YPGLFQDKYILTQSQQALQFLERKLIKALYLPEKSFIFIFCFFQSPGWLPTPVPSARYCFALNEITCSHVDCRNVSSRSLLPCRCRSGSHLERRLCKLYTYPDE